MHFTKILTFCCAIVFGAFLTTNAQAQDCQNSLQYPTFAVDISAAGSALFTINGCNYLEEYSIVTGVPAGEDIEFSLPGGGYITVREGSLDGAVVAQGSGSTTVIAASGTDLYPHWSVDATCLTESGVCVVTTAQYVSCGTGGIDCPEGNFGDNCDDGNPDTIETTIQPDCSCAGGFVPLANDNCEDISSLLACGESVDGTTVGATVTAGSENLCNGSISGSPEGAWYAFSADGSSNYTLTVDIPADIPVDPNEASSFSSQEVVSAQGDSYSNTSGSIDFTIGEVVINTGTDGNNDITQGFHQTNLATSSSLMDAVIFVYSGACGALTEVACADENFSNGAFSGESVTLDTPAAGTYYVQVFNFNEGGEPFTISLECEDTCVNPYPAVAEESLSTTLTGGAAITAWSPTPGQIGCQVQVRLAGGSTLGAQIIGGAGASGFNIPFSVLQPGTDYLWRVRCGCSQTPLIAGPFSSYQPFSTPGGAVISSLPNPTTGQSNVTFSIVAGGYATLNVYDMSGRLIDAIFTGVAQPNNEYRFEFDGSALPSGVYIYRLTTQNEVLIEKFMISR
jgi:hypothetical protein